MTSADEALLHAFISVIADDAYAATFLSLGDYRSALLASFKAALTARGA